MDRRKQAGPSGVYRRIKRINRPTHTWISAVALVLLLSALFLELANDVWRHEGFSWDAPIMLAVHRYSRPWLDRVMLWITQTGVNFAILLLVLLVAWLWRHHDRLEALTFAVSWFGAVSINGLLKILFQRPRPVIFPPLVTTHSYSFPSGHTISAISFYGLTALFLWHRGHRTTAFLAGFWVFAVAFSRVYLGAHYPSDVVGALAAGGIWLILIWEGYLALKQRTDTDPELTGNG